MARFLVAGPTSVTGRDAQTRVLERLTTDGHVATSFDDESDILDALRATDAVIVILDGQPPADHGACIAFAKSQHKPTLALIAAGYPIPRVLQRMLTQSIEGERIDDWLAGLPSFYDTVRPFAGRLVRDYIPELVKEAGHDVTFRALGTDEKPRFLKEKILAEAHQLRNADLGTEKEEIADLLEALETLIRSRGHDRDALKQIKDAKRKRRGGFERGWVVEETQTGATAQTKPPAPTEPTAGVDEEAPTFQL